METLLVDAATARELLSMEECVDVVEEGFRRLRAGEGRVPVRTRIDLPELGGSAFIMPAGAVGDPPGLGTKLATVYPANEDRGIPSVLSLYVLLDPETGHPSCVMDGRYLTNLRTGAATGVALRHLAASGRARVGILGLGVQCLYQLMAVTAVREVASIRAYSPSGEERRPWAERVGEAVGTPVEIAGSARAAVEGADVVIFATSHPGPVADGGWLEPGATVCAVGMHEAEAWKGELDAATFGKAARVVCDSVDGVVEESGDVIGALEDGLVTRGGLVELPAVVAGDAPGRLGDDEIVVFRSVGLAIEDLVAGREIHRRAVAEGRGSTFAFDDFWEPA